MLMEMDLHTTASLPKPMGKVEPRVKKCEETNNQRVVVLAGKLLDGRWGEIPVSLAVLEAVSPVLKNLFSNQGMMSRAEFPQFSYDDLLSFVMVSQFLYRRHEKEKGAFRKYPSLLSFTDQQFEGVADIAGFFQATEILHYLAVYTETYPSKTKVLAVERNLRDHVNWSDAVIDFLTKNIRWQRSSIPMWHSSEKRRVSDEHASYLLNLKSETMKRVLAYRATSTS